MASILNSVLLPAIPSPKLTNHYRIRLVSSLAFNSITRIGFVPTFRSSKIHAATDAPSSTTAEDAEKADEEAISIDNLHRFFNVNLGKWNGSFFQFDPRGNLLHDINTKLTVSSYGEEDLISMIQTLYIKQPTSNTSISGYDDEPEWAEYKIKETNMFTADKYQQLGFFPDERAFSLRYQTAGMLETVLRQGVLGEDDTGEESPKNIKLPSRRPSIVCETCLYLLEKDFRARAFHIMDPKGTIETIIVFLEQKGEPMGFPMLNNKLDNTNRIIPFLGSWRGHCVTKRSGVYGATLAEADTVTTLEVDDEGQIIQDITSTSINGVTTTVHWTGSRSENLITFDGGYQMTILPGGMMMGYPRDVAKSVTESRSFHLEFCWLQGPDKRQRLVRTYDADGLAVSTTYFSELKM